MLIACHCPETKGDIAAGGVRLVQLVIGSRFQILMGIDTLSDIVFQGRIRIRDVLLSVKKKP